MLDQILTSSRMQWLLDQRVYNVIWENISESGLSTFCNCFVEVMYLSLIKDSSRDADELCFDLGLDLFEIYLTLQA